MPSLAERISREQEEDQAESREHVSEAHSPGGAQAHTLLSASVEAEGETRSGAESSVEQTQESEELRETEEIAQELARVGGGSQAAGGGGKSRGKKALGGLKTAGKAVGMGLLNTLLGPLQFVSKSYRKQQVATWKKEYENPALNALQKISTVVSQIGGIAAWGGLITGLTAAILAATGVGIPIAAGFAAASSILCFTSTVALAANAGVKGMQAIGGLIQSTAHTGTKASEIRARALSDFLKGLASLGGAMVGGYMAQANGGSFATTIDSQVQGATTTATGMASQGGTAVGDFGLKSLAGQGFNNAGDLLVAGADAGEETYQVQPEAESSGDSSGEAQEFIAEAQRTVAEAETRVQEEKAQNTQETASLNEIAPKLEEGMKKLEALTEEDPAGRAESAMNGELENADEHDGGEEDDRPIRERVEGYDEQLEKSDSTANETGEAQIDNTTREAEAAQKESRKEGKKSTSWWGRLKGKIKRFFKGAATRAKKRAAAVPKKLIGLDPAEVDSAREFQEHVEQEQADRPQLAAALDQEAELIKKAKENIPDSPG